MKPLRRVIGLSALLTILAVAFVPTPAHAAAGNSISGTVTNSASYPLSPATVTAIAFTPIGAARGADQSAQAFTTATASDGTYSFSNLPDGEYEVDFASGSYSPQAWPNQSYNFAPYSAKQRFTLSGGVAATGINAVLLAPVTIFGSIVAGPGSSLGGDSFSNYVVAEVQDGAGGWTSGKSGYFYTDYNGTFTVSGLAPGTYRLLATSDIYSYPYQFHGQSQVITLGEAQSVGGVVITLVGLNNGLPTPPVGSLDSATGALSQISVAGWALDSDTQGPVNVHVYIDGAFRGQVTADGNRPDVASLYPLGAAHGFTAAFGGISPGAHSICVYALNVGPVAANTLLACRTVTVLSADPFGTVDAVRGSGPGALTVAGWMVDPDATAPLTAHVYVDGAFNDALTSDGSRPDVEVAYPGTGSSHGFGTELTGLSGGAHSVCVYAINQNAGSGNQLLGCRTVTVAGGSPSGSVERVVSAGPAAVAVSGWAIDPDTAAPISVHAYVDGAFNSVLTADGSRPDVGGAFAGYGSAHGFSATLTGLSGGTHTVCLYGINQLAGSNSTLGCKTVTVATGSPFGSVDSVTGSSGGIAIGGWALDPDVAASIDVHVYVDGKFNSVVATSVARSDIAAAFPGYGAAHGFSTTVTSAAGTHTVCVYGINQGATGSNSMIGSKCSQVVVPAG